MKKLLILCFVLFCGCLFSQNETKKWYFGQLAGLDFTTVPPTILTNGVMTTQEGCASIANNAGNLLFYTDGITVWNKLHAIMTNGTGLLGNGSSTQSGVIIKQPGSATNYIVFTLDAVGGANGLRYSIVDMSMSSGNGAVTTKNVLLQTPSTEKLTAVKHCNGSDVWIVSHDLNSNNFRTFLVTSAGVSLTPVNSPVGTVHGNMIGNLKASGNGRKLGLAIYNTNNTFEVYDFDNSSGIVSNPIILGNTFTLPYGCEFSPDGRLFYGCNASTTNFGNIYQWNLCAGSNTAVIASQSMIATTPVSLGSMQLAPNGKIYVARYLQNTIGVINNPNVYGLGCGYVDLAQSVAPNSCRFGLPNFLTSFLNSPPSPFTYTFNPLVNCLGASFTSPATQTCGSIAYTISAYNWDFGDLSSGAGNSSSLANPTHTFSAPGSYSTQLILYYTCGTDTLKQRVVVPTPTISIATTSANCNTPGSGTITVAGTGSYTYSWIPSGQTGSISSNLPVGSNSVTVTGSGIGCVFTATTNVIGSNFFTLSVSTSSLECNGVNIGSATISTTGGPTSFSYSSNGIAQATPTITNLAAGIYTVSATDLTSFCTHTKTLQILEPLPITTTILASSPSVCVGVAPITFTASSSGGSSGYTYSWTGGPSTNTYVVSNLLAGTLIYTVTGTDSHSCSATSTISVDFINVPSLSTQSISICLGTVGTLTASGATSYTWQPGNSIGPSYTASPSSISSYTVNGNNLGCFASATVSIDILPVPTLSFNTFSITCGSLGSATVINSGGIGPFSYTWTPTLQTNSIATGLYPGTYTVKVADVGTGCVFTPTTYFGALVPLTGTVSASNSLTCNGMRTGTANIALSGGSGNQSYLWTDAMGSQTISVPANLSAGINSVNVTDLLTFCSVSHTFLITQPPALTLNISASSPSVCMGNSITYTAVNSGGIPAYSYTWTSSGIVTPTLFVNETTSGLYIYTLTSTDANNCVATKTINSLFVNNPTVSVSSTSICQLAIGTLTASGATSYNWSNGFIGNPMSESPTATKQYTIIGTALGCTASTTGSITLKPSPIANFSIVPLCQGDSLQLSGLGNYAQYLWNGPLGFTSNIQAPSTFYSILPNRSGNYTLKVTAANSCTASITQSLIVNPTPTLSASGATVCQSFPLNFFANFLSGASYSWSGPAGFSSNVQNPTRPNSNLGMTGLYTLNITSATGCTNTASFHASVIPTPTPIIIVNNPNCVGSDLILTGSGGVTYSWFGPNSFNSTLQNPTLKNLSIIHAGTYSLFVNTSSCVAGTNTVILINPLPVPDPKSNSPICESTDLNLTNTIIAQSYTWSGPGGFTTNSQNSGIVAINRPQAGIYTLSITDNNNCTGTSTTSVIVFPKPIIAVEDQSVCLGSYATLTVTGAVNYSWTGPMNYSSVSPAAFIPIVNINNTGIYKVTGTGANNCSATATLQLNGFAFQLPSPTITPSAKACLNSKINLHGSGGINYLWNGPKNFISGLQDVSLIISDSTVGGIYTLSVKNESNCAASSTVLIKVYPQPQGVIASTKNNICAPFCSTIKLNPVKNNSPVKEALFNIKATFFKDSIKDYCFENEGSYLVNVSFKDTNMCINTATLFINAYQKPAADFIYTPLNPLAGIDQVKFYNDTKSSGQMEWTWFLNENDSTLTHDKDPVDIFEKSGVFPVVLIAKNQWGCIDTIIKTIRIDDEMALFIPNAFTPNGDGINDIFQPKGQGITKYTFEIYTRWGEKVFGTNDFYSGWDGIFKGKECKTDIYVWKIVVTGANENTKLLTGNLSLLRAAVKEPD